MDEGARREPAGIGGWLLFFLIVFAIIGPLVTLVRVVTALHGDPDLADAYGESWPTLQAFEWGVTAAAIGLVWYLAWRMVTRRTWRTVQMVVAGLWLNGLGVLMIECAAVSLIAGFPLGAVLAESAPDFSRSVFGTALWTAYLLRSVRVANTYPRRPEAQALAQVFG